MTRIRRAGKRWQALLLGIGITLLCGCGNPCDRLAAITCEKAGEGAVECSEARQRAEKAGSAEKESCRMAYRLYEAAVNP